MKTKCNHLQGAWCLDCVKELLEENKRLRANLSKMRKRLDSHSKESNRRYKQDQDYLPYEDDPYDR